MNSMPHRNRLLTLYLTTYFMYGMCFSVLGPAIPFLAAKANTSQSQFFYLIMMRGFGFILNGLLHKAFFQQYSSHTKLCFGCVFLGLMLIFFSIVIDPYLLGAVTFIMAGSATFITIVITVSILKQAGDDIQFWISLSFGVYGVGSIIGPLIISLEGLSGLALVGAVTMAVGFVYPFRCVSEDHIDSRTSQQRQKEEKAKKLKPIPSTVEKYLILTFTGYAAFTLSIRTLLPTYAVMGHFTSKESAALSISMYSLFLTFFRFVNLVVKVKTSTMMMWQERICLVAVVLSLIGHYLGYGIVVVFGSAAVFGIAFSSYSPLLFALPSTMGFKLQTKNTSNVMIGYSIGQAVISALVGYCMKLTAPVFLFWALLLIGVCMRLSLARAVEEMENHSISEYVEMKENLKETLVGDKQNKS